MSIDTLIFSRERPMQLDLLLRSMRVFGRRLLRPTVLHHPNMSEIYEQLAYNYAEVSFEQGNENVFRDDVQHFLDQASEHVCFLVDDDVFYRTAPDAWNVNGTPASLRPGDYDYLFTLDGGIYEREQVQRWIDGREFNDPTQLEAGIASIVDGQSFAEHLRYPCLVGIPDNRVSPSSNMPHAGNDPAELAQRYLDGERIDLANLVDRIHAAPIITPHMILPYSFHALDEA